MPLRDSTLGSLTPEATASAGLLRGGEAQKLAREWVVQ